jgi:hypothetical protein
MSHIALSKDAKLSNILELHNKFVLTAEHGLAFMAKNTFDGGVKHVYQLLLDEGKEFEILPWPTDQLSSAEYGVEVTFERLDVVLKNTGDLIHTHAAKAGDFLVTEQARIVVGGHKIKTFPSYINIDTGLAATAGNGYAMRFSDWELVAYSGDVEVLRVKRPTPGFFTV